MASVAKQNTDYKATYTYMYVVIFFFLSVLNVPLLLSEETLYSGKLEAYFFLVGSAN